MQTPLSNPIASLRTVTSQWGEDGVIEEIFRRIEPANRYCVEFGAWDGKYLSNTWNLWHNEGWSALLIEGDGPRCEELRKSVEALGRIQVCHALVSIEGENSLDAILARFSVPQDLDLISIDIDGDDYHVFASLKRFQPRVVIVEHNPTVPPHLDIVQEPGQYFGASARAQLNLAHRKGYKLVGCTRTNCFFVRADVFPRLGMAEPELEQVFPRTDLRFLFTAYDGTPYLDGALTYGPPLERMPRLNFGRRKPRPNIKAPETIVPVL
ncbi:MAG: FkbM family methyltransferase, partial [Verrucomicrobiota bacterium]